MIKSDNEILKEKVEEKSSDTFWVSEKENEGHTLSGSKANWAFTIW